ncbi:MAG: choline/carnitine O-acyltransferase [Spirochaetes bacterium]|nr:choline/carnitine O-acyltransferase [Spirochaetota bacterium]
MAVYTNDLSLPALPVPNLAETCELLKQNIKPLADTPVWEKTCAALERFLTGEGPALQKLLEQHRAALPLNSSWLKMIWDDMYLSYRGSLPQGMNYSFEFNMENWSLAALIAGLCGTIDDIRRGQLAPEPTKTGFLSMDALQHMIYTRIPGRTRDILYNPPLDAPFSVAVACRGHWFVMTMIDEKGTLLSPAAVQDTLDQIRKLAGAAGIAPCLGAITAGGREEAATVRSEIQENSINRMNLESIEKTLFAVCLDDGEASGEGFAHTLLGGEPAGRWFDKSLQIIASKEGRVGVNIEHSGCDAAIWIYTINDAYEKSLAGKLPAGKGAPHIRRLEWKLGAETEKRLRDMGESFKQMMGGISVRQRKISAASREAIKAKKCSPDAFAQLLFQAAYYKKTKRACSVYEAVSTRNFYQGRTECVRPVTQESADFVKAFCEGAAGKEELSGLFRAAEKAHAAGINIRQQGLGPERHMAGLREMYNIYAGTAKGVAKPALFDDEGFAALRYDKISTSSSTAPYLDYFGFPPVVPDGLGVGYGLKADALYLTVSSYGKSDVSADAYLDNIEEAALRLLEILS